MFFFSEDKFKIGRVLQFAYHKESLKKAREYKGKTINLTASNIADIGIRCSWYTQESNSDRTFILNTEKGEVVVHQYQLTSSYLCTLTHDSFTTTVCEEESSSFLKQNELKGITTAKQFTPSNQSLALIKKLLEEKTTMRIHSHRSSW